MKKSVAVDHKLYDGEQTVTIPVFYEVQKDGNRTVYKCKIALTEERIPEWLTLSEFEIPIIYAPGLPGVIITAFGDVKGIKNVDTALFVTEVEAQISVAERYNKAE